MDTIQPILKRGRDVWDRINMPEAEFRQRIIRIQETVKQQGLDVLLVYGFGLNEYGNICYLSNYMTRMPWGSLVIVPREGEISLIFQGGSRELNQVSKITWVEDIRSSMNLAQASIQALKERKLLPSVIGIAGLKELMPYREFQSFVQETASCKIVEATHIISDMQLIKSDRELDQIHRASRIVANGFDFLSSNAFVDTSEKLIDAALDRHLRMEGVEDVRLLFGKPMEQDWAMRPAKDTALKESDSIVVYIALAFERYWAEGIRTFNLNNSRLKGSENDKVMNLYSGILSSLQPNKSASDCYKEIVQQVQKNGHTMIPDYGVGQGIGLGLHSPPYLNDQDHTPVKPGMCFAVRMALMDEHRRAFFLGDTVAIALDGPTNLTAQPL